MEHDEQNIENTRPSAYVGLIPAAGLGSRLPGREGAKEMVAFGEEQAPVISHLLAQMDSAGIREATIVLRSEKQDLTDYLATAQWQHMQLNPIHTLGTSGVPESACLGLRGNEHKHIAFGFPDILLKPRNAFLPMMERLESNNADIVLGLFPTAQPEKSDMVKIDEQGFVGRIEIKPEKTKLELTWLLAVWTPAFTRYITQLSKNHSGRIRNLAVNANDGQMGDVFRLALSDGMRINSVAFGYGDSLDIGTPEDLARARFWSDSSPTGNQHG